MIKNTRPLLLTTLTWFIAGQAAVIDIDSATFSSAPNEAIESLTVGGTTYTTLTGATVTNAGSDEYFYDTVDPVTENAALTGLTVTTGTLNTSNGTNFFIYTDGGTTTLNSSDVLFLFDYDFSSGNSSQNDDVTLGLIDFNGDLIGNYELDLVDIGKDASASLLDTGTLTRESGNSFLNENLYGTTFSVSDFTGDSGNLSDAVGVQVINNNPGLGTAGGLVDISNVGLAVIPEPSSVLMLGLGLACMIFLGAKKRR